MEAHHLSSYLKLGKKIVYKITINFNYYFIYYCKSSDSALLEVKVYWKQSILE